MTKIRKLTALTKAGIIEALQFRLGTAVMLFGNLIYLALVYFLWKAIYESSGTDTVNGMTFYDTMIYLILATAIFNFLEMFIVWDMSRAIQSGEIIMHLLKPMRYRVYTFWSYTGAHVNNFFLAFLPTFIAVSLITKGAIPLGINLLWFMVSLILALIVNFNIEMLVAPICLYTESTWGINIVKETIVLLLHVLHHMHDIRFLFIDHLLHPGIIIQTHPQGPVGAEIRFQVFDVIVIDLPAFVDDDDPFAQRVHVAHIMGGQDNGGPLLLI